MVYFSKKIIVIVGGAIILASGIGVFIFFNFIPQKGALRPEQIAQNFFSWYIQQPERPLLGGAYKSSGFLSDSFIKKINKEISSFQETGIDPFLCSTAVPVFSLISEPKILAGKAEVIFNQQEGLQKNQMKTILVLQKKEWKIDNIECFVAKGQEMGVKVYFNNSDENWNTEDCSKVFPVERAVLKGSNAAQTAKNTFLELISGPTSIEKAQGYASWFSQDTTGILESLKIKNEIAYVNLKHDFTSIISGVSSSCGGAEFLSEMTQTLKQFPEIKDIIFAIDGNVAWFYSYLQLSCPEISNNCDSSEFK